MAVVYFPGTCKKIRTSNTIESASAKLKYTRRKLKTQNCGYFIYVGRQGRAAKISQKCVMIYEIKLKCFIHFG